jgi:O-succinylbenzoate synthase
MGHTQDVELILGSLNKDKRELLDKVAEIDKLIKRIKYGNINLRLTQGKDAEIRLDENTIETQPKAFPLKADLKVQVIKIIDIIGVACKLKNVQEKYRELTGINHNLRETLRTLNKHEILKLIQTKGTIRGLCV